MHANTPRITIYGPLRSVLSGSRRRERHAQDEERVPEGMTPVDVVPLDRRDQADGDLQRERRVPDVDPRSAALDRYV